jgi:hypothetical protein
MSSNKKGWIYAFIAAPVLIGAAYGISSWLMTDPAGETVADISLAYGLLLWVGAPIVLVAALPILAGMLKVLPKVKWLARAADHLGRRR